MARMLDNDADYRYSVAWLDCLARGGKAGRGVLTRGNHAEVGDLPAGAHRDPLHFAPTTRLTAPRGLPSGLLNRRAVTAFNAAYYHRAPARGTSVESLAGDLYPLDVMSHWNRMYGPRGFLQYQYAVPYGQEDVVHQTLRRLEAAGKAAKPVCAVVTGEFNVRGGMKSTIEAAYPPAPHRKKSK